MIYRGFENEGSWLKLGKKTLMYNGGTSIHVSEHVKALKNALIVDDSKRGRKKMSKEDDVVEFVIEKIQEVLEFDDPYSLNSDTEEGEKNSTRHYCKGRR